MEEVLRIKKLKEVNKNNPYMTGIRIRYEGETKESSAYKIPLKYLIYNKYNGRIGSLVKSFEIQNHELDPENSGDSEIIEKFLWESKEDRNKTTMSSLVKNGQQRYGIVTNNGIIIDGNRRAMLLNRIYSERDQWERQNHNVDDCQYFIAVVLPEGIDRKEISRLETTYQMGEDEKLDYNPIEKYLKCKDLKEVLDFYVSDIAEMMGEKEGQINEWLEIMKVMDDYLGYLEYDGIYTRLEKREGQFVDLNTYLNRYEKGKTTFVEWGYDRKSDVADLKSVCFDYIRARYEGKEFRYIARPSKKESIFCKKEVWDKFLEEHDKNIEKVEEATIQQIRKENPDGDLSKLLQARDKDWTTKVEGPFQGNLNKSIRRLEDINQSNEPVELLKRAISTLNSVDPNVDAFYDTQVDELLKQINSIAWDYRKLIKKNKRGN
jgi:hypothetical protein